MARGFRRIVGRGFVVATVVAVGAVTLGAGPGRAAEAVAQPAQPHARAVGQIPDGFDGPVTSVAVGADGTQYVGGGFTRWGPQTGGAVVDPTTGALNTSFPPISGTVSAAVSDGSGGFYIGGSFSTVLGQPRRNLAHLNADGSLTAWNPGATWSGGYDYVSSLAVSGSIVYVGGLFDTVGGAGRSMIAAVGTDGTVSSWNPGADQPVEALAVSGSTVYAGGNFSTIVGADRSHVAAIRTDGVVTSWNPDPTGNGDVLALAVRGSTVYVGGEFTDVGGVSRNHLAAIGTDGVLAAWNPNASGADCTNCIKPWVSAIAISGSTVYVGGDFTTMGGTTRNHLAAIGIDGSLGAWNPNVDSGPYGDNTVKTLAVFGSAVYVGGWFTTIGGIPRNGLASVGTDGAILGWNPDASYGSRALAISGNNVYLGGSITTVGGVARNGLAAINPDGTLASWNPSLNGGVSALTVSGTSLYLAGDFTTVNGTNRAGLAEIGTNGALAAWNPPTVESSDGDSPRVSSLAVSGSTLYLGGHFSSIGGTTRNGLAAIGADGNLTSWNPNPDADVASVAIAGSTVYVGGQFTTIGGVSRNGLAAIGTNGVLNSWNPNVDGWVDKLVVAGGTVYTLGRFTTVGGIARSGLAAIGTDGTLGSWSPHVGGTERPMLFDLAVSPSGSTIYVGGEFLALGGIGTAFYTTLAVAPALAAPGTPGKPTAVAGNAQAAATVSAGSGSTPASYLVTASPGGATCTVTGAAGSCVVTGLANGTAYTFTATATNGGGTSAPSPASDAVTPRAPVQPPPPSPAVTAPSTPGIGRIVVAKNVKAK